MSRNSSVNNIIMTWWCDSAAFLFCVFAITMVLSLYPVTSHASCDGVGDCIKLIESNLNEYGSSQITHGGHFTHFPLYLVADRDNSSNSEDIIFGFDGWLHSSVKEKMRLTDEGSLGIGTRLPDASLDVRSRGSKFFYRNIYGQNVGYDFSRTLARFGAERRNYMTPRNSDLNDYLDYYGLKIRVNGHESHVVKGDISYRPSDAKLRTTVGFNLVSAARRVNAPIPVSGDPEFIPPINLADTNALVQYNEIRALTMEFDPDSSIPKVAVGHVWSHRPAEALDVNGAIRIGDTSNENAGTIRYSDGNFQGYDGSQWLPFGLGDNDVVLHSGHQLIFGSTGSHRTPDNFIVNSLNVPDDNVAHFPIPETGSSYNNDDDGTSGGMSLVAGGLPRFTVKGNGNTYVHKRLSIGIGGHVPDTVLTVAGSVHIGPDNLTPTIFDYGDQLTDYLLWVEKGIVSEDFAIANVDNWSDHVLQDDYDLKPLSEVESFIEQEGHLPGVPSAEEVKDNGYTVHEMTRTLLGKVEELTLHTIAQQKALEEQQAEIAQLRAQLSGVQPARHAASFQVNTGF